MFLAERLSAVYSSLLFYSSSISFGVFFWFVFKPCTGHTDIMAMTLTRTARIDTGGQQVFCLNKNYRAC